MKNKSFFRILLFLVVLTCVVLFFVFDLSRYLSLTEIKSHQQNLARLYQQNNLLVMLVFFLIYVAVTALSLPGAAVLTLVAGALFDIVLGLVLVSFASSIGATLAFLTSRFILQESVQSRYGKKLKTINEGMRKEGIFYLITLRLVPVFPFFLINLLMGLTPIKTLSFYLVSQIAMLPGTLVYVFAGTQLGRIDSLSGILSPNLILAFTLLGIFPLLAKKTVDAIRAKKVLKGYQKPKKFDYNLVVIGAGSGGLVSAYIAAVVKAKVALIEKHKMGGDCLNTGCVPSKALIRSAKMLHYAKRAADYGLNKTEVEFDFAKVMQRVKEVIQKIEPHDSIERYTELGVECIQAEAKILDPYRVKAGERVLTTKNIILATGASPLVPPFEGLEKVSWYSSDSIWDLTTKPERMVVLGGGPIGCELAQCFSRLGSKVTQVEMAPKILGREDDEIIEMVTSRFQAEGIEVLTSHAAKRFEVVEGRQRLICEKEGTEIAVEFDAVLIAIGRKANVKGFGLEELGVEIARNGTIDHDEFLKTNFPNIFVCGDVAGPYQFTHTASHQAWYATVNALFRPFKSFRADYSVIPWATFCDPEVARVGLNEKEAKAENIPYEVTRYGIDDLDRAIADSEDYGCVKVLTQPGKDKILGVTIIGNHAGDLIAEFVLAMKQGLGLNKILQTIHIYPTLAEANKYAAGNWRKAHVSEKALRFLEKFNQFQR